MTLDLCAYFHDTTLMVYVYYSGPAEDSENLYHEQRGVIPRSFEYLYSLIKQEMDEVSLLIEP